MRAQPEELLCWPYCWSLTAFYDIAVMAPQGTWGVPVDINLTSVGVSNFFGQTFSEQSSGLTGVYTVMFQL